MESRFDLILFGAYVVVSYVISLWGSEGLMINLTTIQKDLEMKWDYIIIVLKGKVKGKNHERDHIFPCVPVTSSGIDVKM